MSEFDEIEMHLKGVMQTSLHILFVSRIAQMQISCFKPFYKKIQFPSGKYRSIFEGNRQNNIEMAEFMFI